MTTQIAGVQLGLPLLIALAAATQFVVVALIAAIAPLRMKKAFAASTLVLVAAWGFVFDARGVLASKPKTTTADASALGKKQREGSCASIRTGMPGGEVRSKLGMPDEVRSDDKVRGPGSTVLVYKDLRCAVYLFDERVELVD